MDRQIIQLIQVESVVVNLMCRALEAFYEQRSRVCEQDEDTCQCQHLCNELISCFNNLGDVLIQESLHGICYAVGTVQTILMTLPSLDKAERNLLLERALNRVAHELDRALTLFNGSED